MSTKFQLFVIVMIAIFTLSLNVLEKSYKATDKFNKAENVESGIKKSHTSIVSSTTAVNEAEEAFPTEKEHKEGPYTYDDGPFHFFHFNRIKRLRKHVLNLCLFAKILLFITHVALLVLEFMHVLNK